MLVTFAAVRAERAKKKLTRQGVGTLGLIGLSSKRDWAMVSLTASGLAFFGDVFSLLLGGREVGAGDIFQSEVAAEGGREGWNEVDYWSGRVFFSERPLATIQIPEASKGEGEKEREYSDLLLAEGHGLEFDAVEHHWMVGDGLRRGGREGSQWS